MPNLVEQGLVQDGAPLRITSVCLSTLHRRKCSAPVAGQTVGVSNLHWESTKHNTEPQSHRKQPNYQQECTPQIRFCQEEWRIPT